MSPSYTRWKKQKTFRLSQNYCDFYYLNLRSMVFSTGRMGGVPTLGKNLLIPPGWINSQPVDTKSTLFNRAPKIKYKK